MENCYKMAKVFLIKARSRTILFGNCSTLSLSRLLSYISIPASPRPRAVDSMALHRLNCFPNISRSCSRAILSTVPCSLKETQALRGFIPICSVVFCLRALLLSCTAVAILSVPPAPQIEPISPLFISEVHQDSSRRHSSTQVLDINTYFTP